MRSWSRRCAASVLAPAIASRPTTRALSSTACQSILQCTGRPACPHRRRDLVVTTDVHVAEGFARGHRGIRVPDPVVATGTIAKSAVFLATNDRGESEVLGLPHIIKIDTF